MGNEPHKCQQVGPIRDGYEKALEGDGLPKLHCVYCKGTIFEPLVDARLRFQQDTGTGTVLGGPAVDGLVCQRCGYMHLFDPTVLGAYTD
jgi:hypothetical protein